MKALALSARGAAALASALVLAAANFAALAAGPALRPQQISPHCWFVQGGAGMATAANAAFNSNAGFCVTAAGVVLIDALGTPALGAALDEAVRRTTGKPVKLAIVTHFHADHFYGLQIFQAQGAQIWASGKGRETLGSPFTQERLEQRRRDLAPYVNAQTRLVPADRWIDFGGAREWPFEFGGMKFRLIDVGGAHSPEDLMVWVEGERVLFAGDLYFSGRLPFVGNADTAAWLRAIDVIAPLKPAVVVPGHGPASRDPAPDLALTREYLAYLRQTMGAAVKELTPFDEAYAKADWSRYAALPAFEAANRINAYGVYLRMEQEALK
ncbi:MAG TPA: MBL fold metallo-hydrolase [Burkholderiaceae bacterium]|jgi:glyoxylase-like metal-dependent hydrolase (beta-lactamase superfamily II)|nr:MBL fold metallo-hydrolase [Burkholderiaceae bacterium]HPE00557.1 MBL fold metallo-hydrolase [Burkholderiaceae bacterium]HRZ00474.1 MBL fold metallo-hydrolase [Burkholderiaceae bacterium]